MPSATPAKSAKSAPSAATADLDAPNPYFMRSPPSILYRVECHSPDPEKNNSTFNHHGMVSRDPSRRIGRWPFVECLSNVKSATAFIPFTKSWTKAMTYRQELIDSGGEDIVIAAIWTKELKNVLDVVADVVPWIGLRENNSNVKLRPSTHEDEYLVYQKIDVHDLYVLGIFAGTGTEFIPLGLGGFMGSAMLPDDIVNNGTGITVEDKLQHEVKERTGIDGESEQWACLILSMTGVLDIPGIQYRHTEVMSDDDEDDGPKSIPRHLRKTNKKPIKYLFVESEYDMNELNAEQ